MGDVVVSPLLQVVMDKLATPFLQKVSELYGIGADVKLLRRALPLIHAVLADAQAQQLSNRALSLWLHDLKFVSLDLEDLLDEFSPEAIISRTGKLGSLVPPLGRFVVNYVDLLPKLNQVKQDLDVLIADKSSFSLREGFGGSSSSSRRGRQTGSFVAESEVFGREEDREKVVEVLVSECRCKAGVSVVSVVGFGGLGKTTLARLAYNDERVAMHFDQRIWVCVNYEFDAVKVIVSIVESVSRSRCEYLGMDLLQLRLREVLLGKRYLLVLDDVWDEEQSEWDDLRALLGQSGVEGSVVIVTSRSEKVASAMGTSHVYRLGGLSETSSWCFFKQRAIGVSLEERSKFFPIGKEIVKKCGGVPLAVKTLGSLMSTKRDVREWLVVAESNLWDMSETDNGTMAALRLSYSHLPAHLKCCFAYCSVFPKSYVFNKEKIIQMWIAAGFIECQGGVKSLEFIGNEYFNDLVWRFFFQDVLKDDDGNITDCKMHDLIHDLGQTVIGSEFARFEISEGADKDLSSIRHSSVVCDFTLPTIQEALYEAKKLRSLILLLPIGCLGEVPLSVFSSFRYLRVMDLSGSGIKKLDESVSSFIFLKFLDLSNTHIHTLPESVCSLSTLQVMKLSGCYNLTELPTQLQNLSKLRHLDITGCDRLIKMPGGIGKLIYLQTLSKFIVGSEKTENIQQVGKLNLGGDLVITRLENVGNGLEARRADLKGKRNLKSLSLCWGNGEGSFNRSNDYNALEEEVLCCLQPHKYLKKLSVKMYQGSQFPGWIKAVKLPNLTEVVLVNCRRCEYLPEMGQLPFLRVLNIQGMDAVKSIGREFYGDEEPAFSSLRELTLTDFPNLEYWWSPIGREAFSSLIELSVSKCPGLKNMPSFPSLQNLDLRGCNEILLRSASNQNSLTTLVVEEFSEQLVFLDRLLQNNALLMSLKICSCPKLRDFPRNLTQLTNLKTLTVRWCDELLSLPEGLHNLVSLESLEIIECHSLVSLPETMDGLISLRSLSVENCGNITTMSHSLRDLTALEHLTIMYCPKLHFEPDSWEHLKTLKSLSILNCAELVSLPEGLRHATSLQNIEIRGCHGLQSLPEWIPDLTSLRSLSLSECSNLHRLPRGFECLSLLQHLSIRECPGLENRCQKYKGEDWSKIKHITHVYVGLQHYGGRESSSSF